MSSVPVSAGPAPAPVPAPAEWTSADTLAPDSPRPGAVSAPVAGVTVATGPAARFNLANWGPLAAIAKRAGAGVPANRVAVFDRCGFETAHGSGPVAVATDGRVLVARTVRRDPPHAAPSGNMFTFPADSLATARGTIATPRASLATFAPVSVPLQAARDGIETATFVQVNARYLREALDALGDVQSVTLAIPRPDRKRSQFAERAVAIFGHADDYARTDGPEPVRKTGPGSRKAREDSRRRDVVSAVALLMPIREPAGPAGSVADLASILENLARSAR